MKRQKLTEAEARRLGDAIAAEARALGFIGKEKKCRRKQSAASGHGYLKPFSMSVSTGPGRFSSSRQPDGCDLSSSVCSCYKPDISIFCK